MRSISFAKSSWLLGILIFAAAISVLGQQTGLDRPRVYDVKNYIIRISFDQPKKIVYGDTTVELTPVDKELAAVDLDAVDLSFSSVRLEKPSKDLEYVSANGEVNVKLDRGYKPGEIISIRLKYTIRNPKKGIYFIAASGPNDKMRHPAQIWSENEPEDARYWFPSFDFPSDKATSEEFITVRKGELAVGNGQALDQKPNPDGTTTYHFRMDVPYSTYLTSFVVGDFAKLTDKHKNVPLAFYAYKDRQHAANVGFSRTKDMMANFETLTGIPFPFPKYDQIMVSGFQEFDGMENITATTLADTEILFAEYPFGRATVEDLISHELSHSWFGDMVTCRNWAELWLNEGFATYMEAVTREKFYGRENYLHKLAQDRDEFFIDDAMAKKHHAVRNESAKGDNSVFDATIYQKGGLVLHMLHETVGDTAFWKAVNIYLTRHKFDTVTTADLQAAMEEASGQKLQWFFDQWVYAAGYPKLEVRQVYDQTPHQLKLTIDQVQKEDGITPAAYRLPLEVTLTTPSGPVDKVLDLTQRSETFTFDVPVQPTKIEIDKNEKIILKTLKIK